MAFPFVPASQLGMWPDGLEGARFAPRPLPSSALSTSPMVPPPSPMLTWPASVPELDFEYPGDEYRPAGGEESTEKPA